MTRQIQITVEGAAGCGAGHARLDVPADDLMTLSGEEFARRWLVPCFLAALHRAQSRPPLVAVRSTSEVPQG